MTTTKTTPADLAFGRNMLINIQHQTNWAEAYRRRVDQMTKDNIRENRSRAPHDYNPGDLVLINVSSDPTRPKSKPTKEGPFTIVATHPERGTVTLDRNRYLERVHIRRLIPYRV